MKTIAATTIMQARTAFTDATRVHTSVLARTEKQVLIWLACRLPPWINSDHLTALALVAMLGAGLSGTGWRPSRPRLSGWLCCAWRSTGSATASMARSRACDSTSVPATASTWTMSSTWSGPRASSVVWACPGT